MAGINPIAAVIQIAPSVAPVAAANGNQSMATSLQQILQQQQQSAGTNAGAPTSALDAIDRIAANANAKPKPRAQRDGERDVTDERDRRPKQQRSSDELNPLSALF